MWYGLFDSRRLGMDALCVILGGKRIWNERTHNQLSDVGTGIVASYGEKIFTLSIRGLCSRYPN